MSHKLGCLWSADVAPLHRVPIDCVTEKMLWDSIDKLKSEKTALEADIVHLKARIFDLQEKE